MATDQSISPARPPEVTNTISRCRRCGALHRSWAKLAECRFRPEWVDGDGPFGSFAWCPRGLTIVLRPTREEAQRLKEFADRVRCGGLCCLDHTVEDLRTAIGRRVVAR
jgi:hypothetical protein